MAVSENDTSDCNSDSSADGMAKERKERPFTKAIIRRLPPSMNKDTFLTQISPVPDYDYMYFVKADMSLGEFAFSRAYINFKNSSDIFIFKEKFDNYVFVDAKGNEYTAVVEFAPFSRIPKKRNKTRIDPKLGSIESDPIYAEFLESLKVVETNENEEKPEYCFQPATDEEKQKVVNTPLLDFIKQRRIDRQKIREEKREERKRKELERKRFKEEERRRRGRPDNPSYNKSASSKNIQILNASKDLPSVSEDKKDEPNLKNSRERKFEDTKYERKPNVKDDRKYPAYQKTKEIRKSSEEIYKKSPSKLRQRTFEKSEIKSKLDTKRKDDYRSTRRVNEYNKDIEEDKTVEKKVKKYSERREERKNEIKKLDTVKPEDKPGEKEPEIKEELKLEDLQDDTSKEHKSNESSKQSDDSDDKNDDNKDLKDENDPRTQRRIRNKDRPTRAIYQPGMRFRKKPDSNSDAKLEPA